MDSAAERTSRLHLRSLFKRLGPGVITGAADDDPSGIATYSQTGAQAGFSMLWTVVLTWPLLATVQSVSARIGRVTGHGLAANMAIVFPRPIVSLLVLLLLIANTVNIGADLAAMGAAAALVVGWGSHIFTVLFAAISLLAVIFVPYHRYVGVLKWLTLSLLTYVGVIFAVDIDWRAVVIATFVPRIDFSAASLTLLVAIFGTTISPYLFFWQSSEEVEDEEADPEAGPLIEHPEQASRELNRIGWETWLGMALANLIFFFIVLTTAATLHASGVTDIQTSQQAAAALRPIAGDFAFALFSLGIIGTGLLAVPVLAGSAAYAVGEIGRWPIGLERLPTDAKRFYAVIGAAIIFGLVVDFSPIDPIKALFGSAVLNGIMTVPIMAAMMIVASRRDCMGPYVATPAQQVGGWFATTIMAAASLAMFILM
jgi:NRAMP (natural resistance-associated macrophage protein)-like metal ion transporter